MFVQIWQLCAVYSMCIRLHVTFRLECVVDCTHAVPRYGTQHVVVFFLQRRRRRRCAAIPTQKNPTSQRLNQIAEPLDVNGISKYVRKFCLAI